MVQRMGALKRPYLWLAATIACFVGALLLGLYPALIALVFFGLMAAALVLRFGWEARAFELLAFALPLSVKVPLTPALDMNLPAEGLIFMMALLVAWHILFRGGWKQVATLPFPALWVLTFLVPTFTSEMLAVSIKFTLLNATYVAVFFYGFLVFRPQLSEKRMVGLFALSLALVAFWSLLQFARYGWNPITVSGIFKPFFTSHTTVGALAAMLIAYHLPSVRRQKWALLAVSSFTALLFYTTSRAAIWSFALTFPVLALYFVPRKLRLLLPLALLAVSAFLAGPQLATKLFDNTQYESHDPNANVLEESMSVTNISTDASNMERLNRWTSALRMFQERPWFGFGPGTYQFTYIPYQEPSLENRLTVRNPNYPPPGSGGSAHNEWLLQLSENGWPSAVLFVAMLIGWTARGLFAGRAEIWSRAPYFLALFTYFVHLNFNNFLNQPAFAFLFWLMAAALSGRVLDARQARIGREGRGEGVE